VVFTPTTANDTVIPGRGTAYSTSVQNASNSFESFSASSLANRRQAFVPAAGNLDQFFVISNAPGSGTQYAYAVAKNGVTTGTPPTCTIANTATTCNDTATSALSIADGDDLSFAATPSTTPAAATAAFGARFVPTSTPNFVFMGVSSSATDNATATRFLAINGSNISATETDVQTVVNSLTVTRMEIHLSGTAGGTSKAFTLNDNTSPTSLTCTIAAAASTCTATGSVAVTAAHLLSISDVPTGTTNARTVSVSLVANR
jgi:hypothetical protein